MDEHQKELALAFLIIAATIVAVVSIAVALAGTASAYEVYTNNEQSTSARWLNQTTDSHGPVAAWKRQGGDTNVDWWRFNATANQVVSINFRKYDQTPNLGLPGYSWYLHYEVMGPFSATTQVYSYETAGPGWGQQPNDGHRRDSYAFTVPENVPSNGNYFIHVWLDTPQQNPWANWAFYWLNVTVSPRFPLDSQRTATGIMEVRSNYSVDFDFADRYFITLNAAQHSGDYVRAHLSRDVAGAHVWVEAYEVLRFGSYTDPDFMLNRSHSNTGTDIDIFFTADHAGVYEIRVLRDFWDPGKCGYTLDVSVSSRALDGDDTPENGTYVPKAMTLKRQPIEMGLNTHEWYRVQLLNGDTTFKVSVEIEDPAGIDGHGFGLYVYNPQGIVMWSAVNREASGQGYAYHSRLEVPPTGTVTIFDTDVIYYVRLSMILDISTTAFQSLMASYNVTFALTNRAPVLETPFEAVYEWDEDTDLAIELDSHFSDPDGDPIQYTLFNKTPGWVYDVASLNYEGWLNITPPADWSGVVWWRLRASDPNPPNELHYIFVDLKLKVLEVSDPPRSNGSLTLSCDEEGSATADLTKLFYDIDPGPGGVLTFAYDDDGLTPVDVMLGIDTGELRLTPLPDVAGTFTLTFHVTDDLEQPVTGTVTLVVRAINDVPRIVSPIPGASTLEGSAPTEVDVGAHFMDPDGDALTYLAKFPRELDGIVNVYNRNNVATEPVLIIELLDDDWYGTFVVNVTAKDPSQTFVAQDFTVTVANSPDRPTAEWVPQGNPPDIDEGAHLDFSINVYDADVPENGLHTYKWFIDGSEVAEHNMSTLTYTASYQDAGTHTVRVEVTDPTGLSPAPLPEWTFRVRDINRAPTAKITPPSVTNLTSKDLITLSVVANDPDSDTLQVSWYLVGELNDELLGSGATIQTKLPSGRQTIDVEVSDGKASPVRDSYVVYVSKVEEEGGGAGGMLLAIILIVVLVVVVAVVLVMMRGRKKKAEKAATDKVRADALAKAQSTPKDFGDYEEIHR
jgi:hypothetical protein